MKSLKSHLTAIAEEEGVTLYAVLLDLLDMHGWDPYKIAREIGWSILTINALIDQQGVDMPSPADRVERQARRLRMNAADMLCEMLQEMSPDEVAEKVGMQPKSFATYARRRGICADRRQFLRREGSRILMSPKDAALIYKLDWERMRNFCHNRRVDLTEHIRTTLSGLGTAFHTECVYATTFTEWRAAIVFPHGPGTAGTRLIGCLHSNGLLRPGSLPADWPTELILPAYEKMMTFIEEELRWRA
jgi:hypothetical protein